MIYSEISSNKRKTALLITFFLVLIIALGYFFGQYFDSPGILPIAVIFSVGLSLTSYFYSDKIILSMSHAKQIQRADDPELYHTVENLAIAAGLPTPKIYLIDDTAPNAFATGRDPKHAVVCITTGLRSKLTKPELEGVIAHELSHVGNYDIRLSTIIVVLVGVVSLLSNWMLRASFFGGRRRNNEGEAGVIFMVVGLVLAILSPIAATLIQLAISRKREYLADASGALLTRYPEGLASALKKIAADTEPLEEANNATAHLYIVNPFKQNLNVRQAGSALSRLFDTHPPIQERIKRLEEMEK
ncbi:MAG: zinc metalloprotease HtpX [Candidatus Doudnabacteria bacterium]